MEIEVALRVSEERDCPQLYLKNSIVEHLAIEKTSISFLGNILAVFLVIISMCKFVQDLDICTYIQIKCWGR
jgi:hypothetical protein